MRNISSLTLLSEVKKINPYSTFRIPKSTFEAYSCFKFHNRFLTGRFFGDGDQ
jgi:hypothetical protein